jgi:hypothetical protein
MARLADRSQVDALRCDANSKSSKTVRASAFCTIAFLEIHSRASAPAILVKIALLEIAVIILCHKTVLFS